MKKISLIVFSLVFCYSCKSSGEKAKSIHPNKENLLPEDAIDNYLYESTDVKLIGLSSLSLYTEIGDNNEHLIGKVITAKLIDSSQVVVLDDSKNRLRVFDAQTGKLQASLAREGRGPGELTQPSAMEVLGKKIMVGDRLLKLSFYSMEDDSISFSDEIRINYSPNRICGIGNFVFVTGIDLKRNYTIYKYDVETFELLGQFHETYKSNTPLVRTMLSNNLISCNSTSESILVVSPYLPYVYSYDTDGKLQWVSKIDEFHPMAATEGIGSNGKPSLNQSYNKNGLTDFYLNFNEQKGSDSNFLQILRTEKSNGESIASTLFTYKIDSYNGKGRLVSNETFRILSLTNDYLIISKNEEYPTVNLFKNPFNEL